MKYTSSFKGGVATHYIKDEEGNYYVNTTKAGEEPNKNPAFWQNVSKEEGEAIWKEIFQWHESYGNDPLLSVFDISPKYAPPNTTPGNPGTVA